ncbi:MAG: hypothetical protein WBD63_01170 [Phycisphaerae bacterium]
MKPWKKVLIVAIVVSALVLAPAATWLGILSVDEAPLDDSDLRVERAEVPDEENGYGYFTRMSEVVDMPEETGESSEEEGEQTEPPTGRALVDAILEGRAWDADFVADLWRRNEEAIRLLDEGLACETVQAPPMAIGTLIPEVFGWIDVARLVDLHTVLLFKQGVEVEAFEEAMRLVRFGQAIEGSKGGMVHYLVGAMVKGMGLARLRAMSHGTTLGGEVLTSYARRLGAYGANEQGMADAFRVEYEMCLQVLEDYAAGKFSLEEFGRVGSAPSQPASSRPLPFFFHPNETRNLFVQAFRPMVESASLPFSEAQVMRSGIPARHLLDGWRLWLEGNGMGVRLYSILSSATDTALKQKCREASEVAATRVLLAMKAFKVEKRRLPETLDELVPEYLDAVPLDDFDGKPLRYNAENKVLYSVGEDLKDGGGMTKEEQKTWWSKEHPGWNEEEYGEPDIWGMPDPSFPIAF